MIRVAVIAAGGAAGALLRYYLSQAVHAIMGHGFPYGTLVVNVVGSALMGFLFVLFDERMDVSIETRAALLIGVLGAFTTFSTFSLETLNLIENGEQARAAVNVLASVALCVLACWAGIVLARQM